MFYSFQLMRSSNYTDAEFVFGHDDTVHRFHLWTQMGTGVCYTLQFRLSAFIAHFTLRHSLRAYYISSCAQTRHRYIGVGGWGWGQSWGRRSNCAICINSGAVRQNDETRGCNVSERSVGLHDSWVKLHLQLSRRFPALPRKVLRYLFSGLFVSVLSLLDRLFQTG